MGQLERHRLKMEAYLDNAATTKALESVKDIMVKTLSIDYGNPSSMHRKGFEAEKYITQAKEIIAKNLKVDTKEIVFTSGGTEANNMAIIGAAMANKRSGKHIITSSIEHPSVHKPMEYLEDNGFCVTYTPVDHNGNIIEDKLLDKVTDETIVVSLMYVNNEIGSVQNITRLAKLLKEKNPNLILHVDAIQAFGKYMIYPKREGIDLLSISGHKIHGPKGCGVLYVKDKIRLKPLLFGGGQQKGMRSGTENVPAIAGIGQAVEEIYQNHEDKVEFLYNLKREFINGIKQIDGTVINGKKESIYDTAPHIVSVSFEGVRSEVLLHALEDKNVYVSAGSACASNHPGHSGTLKAIGLRRELLESTLRFSFSYQTTMEEIHYAIDTVKEILPILRKYTRK